MRTGERAQGLFHTDPHPGNLMVCASTEKLVMLDMGQMKVVDYATMVDLSALMVAMASRDEELILMTLDELDISFMGCDRQQVCQSAAVATICVSRARVRHCAHRLHGGATVFFRFSERRA